MTRRERRMERLDVDDVSGKNERYKLENDESSTWSDGLGAGGVESGLRPASRGRGGTFRSSVDHPLRFSSCPPVWSCLLAVAQALFSALSSVVSEALILSGCSQLSMRSRSLRVSQLQLQFESIELNCKASAKDGDRSLQAGTRK